MYSVHNAHVHVHRVLSGDLILGGTLVWSGGWCGVGAGVEWGGGGGGGGVN